MNLWVDAEPLERTRRRTFEIDSIGLISAAVTRALKLAVVGRPVRNATQVGANDVEGRDAALLADHPDALGLESLRSPHPIHFEIALQLADADARVRLLQHVGHHESPEGRTDRHRSPGPEREPTGAEGGVAHERAGARRHPLVLPCVRLPSPWPAGRREEVLEDPPRFHASPDSVMPPPARSIPAFPPLVMAALSSAAIDGSARRRRCASRRAPPWEP